jgi:hypothetical protein
MLIRSLLAWHGPKTLIAIKMLRAQPGCEVQLTHIDCPDMEGVKGLSVTVAQFSALLALEAEDNITSLSVGEYEWVIKPGQALFWRACFSHAGSCYLLRNFRLFISISSLRYPMSLDVGIQEAPEGVLARRAI